MVGGGSVCGDWGVLALVMDFREVMLTSLPELAHCAPPPPLTVGHDPQIKDFSIFGFYKSKNAPKRQKARLFRA